MTNRYDKGIFDTMREHNAIAINTETETRSAMDDAKIRFDYSNRIKAWGRQKRKTWIPLVAMIIALQFEIGVFGSGMGTYVMGGRATAIMASAGIVVNLTLAWFLTYALLSRGTGVYPGAWNLAVFSALSSDDVADGMGVLLDFDHHDRHKIVVWMISAYVAAGICFFASETLGAAGDVILFLGIFVAPIYMIKLFDATAYITGPLLLFPEYTTGRINAQIESAWRRDPTNPTVSRRSKAGRGVLAARAWLSRRKKHQQGGTNVRTA